MIWQGDNVAEQSYMTIDDIAESLGISPKKIRKKIKKKGMTIFLNEDEVVKVFKKYFPKAE